MQHTLMFRIYPIPIQIETGCLHIRLFSLPQPPLRNTQHPKRDHGHVHSFMIVTLTFLT